MQDSVNGAHNRLPVKSLDISLGISSDFTYQEKIYFRT
jgi:hypothetical protein